MDTQSAASTPNNAFFYFEPETPDDGLPTHTSTEQRSAEQACQASYDEYADEEGNIDREMCV